MDAGVAGVVAMRYNVYVVTAAQFVAELYTALAQGQTLGEAVTLARKQLAAEPAARDRLRPAAAAGLDACRSSTRPRRSGSSRSAGRRAALRITRRRRAQTGGGEDGSTPALPPPPDVGFFGRDETLLALDRAFDTDRSSCCTPTPAAARPPRPRSSPAGTALTGGRRGAGAVHLLRALPAPAARAGRVGQVFGPLLERPASTGWRSTTPGAAAWPCRSCAGAGAVGLGQRGAGGRLPGRHGVGLERGGAGGAGRLPARRAGRPRRRSC